MLTGGRLFTGASVLVRMMTAGLYATRGLLGRSVRDVMQEMLKTPQRRQEGDQRRSDELVSRGTHMRGV